MAEQFIDTFSEKLPQRSLGVIFFIDWLMSNKDNYDFVNDDYYLEGQLYRDYVDYWNTLGDELYAEINQDTEIEGKVKECPA